MSRITPNPYETLKPDVLQATTPKLLYDLTAPKVTQALQASQALETADAALGRGLLCALFQALVGSTNNNTNTNSNRPLVGGF